MNNIYIILILILIFYILKSQDKKPDYKIYTPKEKMRDSLFKKNTDEDHNTMYNYSFPYKNWIVNNLNYGEYIHTTNPLPIMNLGRYEKRGYISQNNDRLPLYGRLTEDNNWQYYVLGYGNKYIKLENNKQIQTDDVLKIKELPGKWKVYVYKSYSFALPYAY